MAKAWLFPHLVLRVGESVTGGAVVGGGKRTERVLAPDLDFRVVGVAVDQGGRLGILGRTLIATDADRPGRRRVSDRSEHIGIGCIDIVRAFVFDPNTDAAFRMRPMPMVMPMAEVADHIGPMMMVDAVARRLRFRLGSGFGRRLRSRFRGGFGYRLRLWLRLRNRLGLWLRNRLGFWLKNWLRFRLGSRFRFGMGGGSRMGGRMETPHERPRDPRGSRPPICRAHWQRRPAADRSPP